MDYLALRDEILGNPDCANFVVTPEMPKDSDVFSKDSAIAAILSSNRVRIVNREVGDGALSLALGIPAGPIFMYKLKRLAATVLPDSATDEQIAPVAIAQQAVGALAKAGFDVGDPQVRIGLELFNGTLLTTAQISSIKALAESPDIITAADVSRALRGPWE